MSASSLPKVRIQETLPNVFTITHPKSSLLLNLTGKVYSLLLSPVSPNKVDTVACAILGRRGSGKSVMMTSIAKLVCDYYGAENVNIVWSTSLKYCLDHMDEKTVQLLLIDDAMQEQSSRRIHKNTKDLARYYKIRHIHKERRANGKVITIWAWQRWMDLDIAYRQSIDIVWLKTGQADEVEKEHMRKLFGDACYKYVVKNWSYTFAGDDNAKSRSIVHIVPLEDSGFENGVFIQKKLDFPEMPEFIDISKIEKEESTETESSQLSKTEIIEKEKSQRIDPKWPTKVKCYKKVVVQGKSIRVAAAELAMPHATVARYAKEVQTTIETQPKDDGTQGGEAL